jgi:phosphoadenosine phosphosulfate reductase
MTQNPEATILPPADPHATPADINQSLEDINDHLGSLSATARIGWAYDTFGDGLYATTSAGRDSALQWHAIHSADVPVGLTFANTGFLHPDTLDFKSTLVSEFGGLVLHECAPEPEQVEEVKARQLWRDDPEGFMGIVKLEPLKRQSQELGVTALMSAVHHDQTANRAELDYLTRREDGSYRMHPFLDWTAARVEAYLDSFDLPRNPLPLLDEGIEHRRIVYHDGTVELLGIAECGLHVVDGSTMRQAA